MSEIITYIHQHTGWLYVRIVDSGFLFFDFWSLVHFWTGLVLFLSLRRLSVRNAWGWLAAAIVGWELFELLALYIALDVFRPETLKDQLTDIVVGILGAKVAAWLEARPRTLRPNFRQGQKQVGVPELLAAVTLAFLWVGNYGYAYNWERLNSAGLNYWAFSLWTGTLLAELVVLYRLEVLEVLEGPMPPLLVLWIMHIAGMFVGEYVGYRSFGIHEIGHVNTTSLCCGLVHGTRG
jgi:uncharacterized membrane protein YeaQ/YmgE (transglycosylase-associated protein family)